jgi:putative phosphoribosyl transferase
MWGEARFQDRSEAGRKLAEAILNAGVPSNPVVLALPRGGVPVAYEIATRLRAPLDLLIVRKIGAPGHPEFGIGAVIDGTHPQTVVNDEAVAYTGATADYIEQQTQKELAEIDRRRKIYLGDREPVALEGRSIILVDDGIATGGTVRAGLMGLRQAGVGSILLAVPTAPPDVLAALEDQVDRTVCLDAPDRFGSVGAQYVNFEQTTDDEVISLLEKAAAFRR